MSEILDLLSTINQALSNAPSPPIPLVPIFLSNADKLKKKNKRKTKQKNMIKKSKIKRTKKNMKTKTQKSSDIKQ